MKIIRIARKRKKVKRYTICPQCKTKIICENKPGKKEVVKCPNCGKKGIIVSPKEKKDNFVKSKIILRAPEKITLKKIIWILLSFFTTVTILSLLFIAALGKIHLETLYVTIFIGIMILREKRGNG